MNNPNVVLGLFARAKLKFGALIVLFAPGQVHGAISAPKSVARFGVVKR